MRGTLLAAALACAGCIDLDVFTARSDGGDPRPDLAGSTCALEADGALPLSAAPSANDAPAIAWVGGSLFLVGDAGGTEGRFALWNASTGIVDRLGSVVCGVACAAPRATRGLLGIGEYDAAVLDGQNGNGLTFDPVNGLTNELPAPCAGTGATSVDFLAVGSSGGEVFTACKGKEMSLRDATGPSTGPVATEAHGVVVSGTVAFVAHADTTATVLESFNPTTLQRTLLASLGPLGGLGIDARDADTVVVAGYDADGKLTASLVRQGSPTVLTSQSSTNAVTPAIPVGVALDADGVTLVHDGPGGMVLDRVTTGGTSMSSAPLGAGRMPQIAGDPTAPLSAGRAAVMYQLDGMTRVARLRCR